MFCISGDKPQFENTQEELAMLTLPWTTQFKECFPETLKIVWQGEGEDGEEYNSEGDLAETGEKYTWKESGNFCYLSLGIVW